MCRLTWFRADYFYINSIFSFFFMKDLLSDSCFGTCVYDSFDNGKFGFKSFVFFF